MPASIFIPYAIIYITVVWKFYRYIGQSPVCQQALIAVQDCYQANKDRTLNCSDEVGQFTSCVREYQLNYVSDVTNLLP